MRKVIVSGVVTVLPVFVTLPSVSVPIVLPQAMVFVSKRASEAPRTIVKIWPGYTPAAGNRFPVRGIGLTTMALAALRSVLAPPVPVARTFTAPDVLPVTTPVTASATALVAELVLHVGA